MRGSGKCASRTSAPSSTTSDGTTATGSTGTTASTSGVPTTGTNAGTVDTATSTTSEASTTTDAGTTATSSTTSTSTTGGSSDTGIGPNSTTVNSALRYQVVRLHVLGTPSCVTTSGSVGLSACGGSNQELRIQVLSDDYLSIVDNLSGRCLEVSGSSLALATCTNAPAQQFSYGGSAASGYTLKSFPSGQWLTDSLGLGSTAATFEVVAVNAADKSDYSCQ